MKKLPLIEASAVLMGTVIGAGVLGIPYAIGQVGFGWGVVIMLVVAVMTVILQLMFAEVTVRTPREHQIPGYGGIYLGGTVKNLAAVVGLIGWYGALLAYVIGEGEVLQALFGGTSVSWSLIFWVIASALVFLGLQSIAASEVVMSVVIFLVVLAIGLLSYGHVDSSHLLSINFGDPLIPYGVLLFAFAGTSAIPQMRHVLRKRESDFPRVIILANVAIFAVYLFFTYIVLGVTGPATSQVATVGLGARVGPHIAVLGNVLAAFTMGTSFLTIGLAVRETFALDYNLGRYRAFLLTIIVPFVLFVMGARQFILILSVVGGVLLGIQNIIIIASFWRALVCGKRMPEFGLGGLRATGIVLILIFAIGVVLSVVEFI